MEIRRASENDRERLIPLIEGYFDFYRTPYPAPGITSLLDRLQADESLGVQLVAEDKNQLLGFVSLYSCIDTLVAGSVLVMNDLFVTPNARGIGIGAALLRAAREYAAKAGYLRLDWVTAQDNLDAQRFYDREGAVRGPWLSYSLPIR